MVIILTAAFILSGLASDPARAELATPMFLVIKKYHPDPDATTFIALTVGVGGRNIIRNASTVPYRDGLPLTAKPIHAQNAVMRRGLYKLRDME